MTRMTARAFFFPIAAGQLRRLRHMIETGNEAGFYKWAAWVKIRAEVLRLDNYECQICKARGRYRRGAIVHHVKHLRDRPDLALSIRDPDTGERQLLTVCKRCHEELHPEGMRQTAQPSRPLTAERWD